MTNIQSKGAYDLYAEIGRFLTQFNVLELNLRMAFERAVGHKFGTVLGAVQTVSSRLNLTLAALKAVENEEAWARQIIDIEKDIRDFILFRNELSHGFLSSVDVDPTLIVRMWDTDKTTRMKQLTVDDMRKKNNDLDMLLFAMVVTAAPPGAWEKQPH